MGEKLMFCISDAFIDGDRIRGSIHNVVDKAFESGIKMSSCRYKDHSITLDESISFDDAMALSELEAYKKCKEYYERLVKK